MIECIKAFKKSTPIITIVNYLEMRYNASVSFSSVYYQFRRFKPLFGKDDAQNLIEFLK